MRLTRQELHWRTDMMETSAGALGGWWQERLARHRADSAGDWREWQRIRMTEYGPALARAPRSELDGATVIRLVLRDQPPVELGRTA